MIECIRAESPNFQPNARYCSPWLHHPQKALKSSRCTHTAFLPFLITHIHCLPLRSQLSTFSSLTVPYAYNSLSLMSSSSHTLSVTTYVRHYAVISLCPNHSEDLHTLPSHLQSTFIIT